MTDDSRVGSGSGPVTIYSDGASRGNPGPAGIGAILLDQNENVIAEISEGIGTATNNEAEYIALAKALETAKKLGAKRVRVYTDSELMARQLTGEYAVRSDRLRPLAIRVQELRRGFESCAITHVGRAVNSRADELANRGIEADSSQGASARTDCCESDLTRAQDGGKIGSSQQEDCV
ncbi:MAG: ribonuclease HI family protein [Bacillota bacterium]